MAFKGTRGLVLRTTRPMTVKGQSLAKGTRVKFMAPVEGKKDQLKVKVQDSRYPKIRGEHTVVSYSAVTKVGRGRPSGEAPVKAKATVRKPAKKVAAKRSAPKKVTSGSSTPSASQTSDSGTPSA